MKLKAITTDAEYRVALMMVDKLMDAPVCEAELDIWSASVEKYEEEHFPITEPNPLEAIQFRMEQEQSR